jgi:hypothetical protein
MADFTYRGITTNTLYKFLTRQDPQVNGVYTQKITILGETAVFVNRDGSITRGVHGPAPADDIYSPGLSPSVWEQQ